LRIGAILGQERAQRLHDARDGSLWQLFGDVKSPHDVENIAIPGRLRINRYLVKNR
jgi:hypothetical protein